MGGALGTTFCWGVKEAELGKEELNWVAGATEASHNLMGALELAWPFGLGPNEARRLGLCVPHVYNHWMWEGTGGGPVPPIRQGQFLESLSSEPSAANPSGSWGNENGVPWSLLLGICLFCLEAG